MRTPILDQPLISMAGGHVEKVDRDHADEFSIRASDIVHGKERIGDGDIRFDEADPVVRKDRLRGGSNGLLRLWTEVLHHVRSPLQKVTHGGDEGSMFSE